MDREAPVWRERLAALHDDFFGAGQGDPLAPVQLEVLDRATDETLQRLAEAGLLALTSRCTRPLWPLPEASAAPASLSPAERERAEGFRQQGARRLKMARLLEEGGLSEEARVPLLEAIHLSARALAIENRVPESVQVEEALLPPVSALWPDKVPVFRGYLVGGDVKWSQVAAALG